MDGRASALDDTVVDGRKVRLVAESRGQPSGDPLGVVARPVEPMVHRGLDAAAKRLEQRERGECRGGDRQRAFLRDRGKDGLEPDDEDGEQREDRSCRDGPTDRPADDPVDLVQAVPGDRDPDRDRDQRIGEHRGRPHPGAGVVDQRDRAEGEDDRQQERPERAEEPLALGTLKAPGAPISSDEGADGDQERREDGHVDTDLYDRPSGPPDEGAERIANDR